MKSPYIFTASDKVESILNRLEHHWLNVSLNDIEFRGYLTRDYSLTPNVWMLSFTNRNNLCFEITNVVEFNLATTTITLTGV